MPAYFLLKAILFQYEIVMFHAQRPYLHIIFEKLVLSVLFLTALTNCLDIFIAKAKSFSNVLDANA
jgi:hypothetical protein